MFHAYYTPKIVEMTVDTHDVEHLIPFNSHIHMQN